MMETKHPYLPPLYLNQKYDEEQEHVEHRTATTNGIIQATLPSELIVKCLVEFGTWGDLATLSTVQYCFKDLVRDAAQFGGMKCKWELAQALLEGTHGLQQNPTMAVKYLLELSLGDENRSLNEEEFLLRNERNAAINQNESFLEHKTNLQTSAIRRLALCYFKGNGVKKAPQKGMKWLKYAALEGNSIDAAHEIALIYECSLYGVVKDYHLSAKWYKIFFEI